MRFRVTLALAAAFSALGLFGPGMSGGATGLTGGNSVGGGGLETTSLSNIGPLNFGLGVTANSDGTNVRGEITITDPLTTAPLASVTVHATCLIVRPANHGGLLAVTGGTVIASTGFFATVLHRGDPVFVKAFDAAPGSYPSHDALNSADGCFPVPGDIPPLFNPVVSGNIIVKHGS